MSLGAGQYIKNISFTQSPIDNLTFQYRNANDIHSESLFKSFNK